PYEERQLECLDLSHYESVSEVEGLLEQHKRKPLPLLDSELFRFLIVKISEEEYWINIKMHHIISDGISRKSIGLISRCTILFLTEYQWWSMAIS
ncbi:condensation domain-containing protein, partial [Paenibacillus polymyxa]|uniref:condensation domain-containing protein n=1 Tax=Paenibacillus polymyxa TaxID=1406 RepID=UPI0006C1CD3C